MNIQRKLVNKHIGFLVIMIFQFFGTMLFTYTNLNLTNLSNESTSIVLKQLYSSIFFSLSLFMCLVIGRQFSGGLYNPSIVIYRMLRIKQRFTIKIGLAYLITQFLGAIAGSIFGFWINDLKYSTIMKDYQISYQLRNLYFEIIGTFVLATMIQYINEKKMTFIEHNREFYICIPIILLVSRQYSSLSNALNPATGFGFQLAYCIFHNRWDIFYETYILVVGPIIGSIIAVIIFQNILKPLYPLRKSQIQRQIAQMQKIKEEQRMKEQQNFIRRLSQYKSNQITESLQKNNFIINESKINYQNHKYTLSQINSLKNEEEIYLKMDDEYTVVEEITFYDQTQSVYEPDQEQQQERQLQQISLKKYLQKKQKDQTQTVRVSLPSISKLSRKGVSERVINKFKYTQT